MTRKNFKLVEAIWEQKTTQCELVRTANIASEARLSRIVNGLVDPTTEEVARICAALKLSPTSLGFNKRIEN